MSMHEIAKAVAILQQGGVVAIPTETVYGLGADARNPTALGKVFHIKQRPTHHPLIVHLADSSLLEEWARDVSAAARCLAEAYWPGPLTLVLKKAPGVLDLITGGQDTIAVRVPRHPVALALLQQYGSGIAAPSANRFGRISPTTAAAVREELGEAVDLVLEGGQCEVGLESTIVDVSGERAVVLRPGMITTLQIEEVLQQRLGVAQQDSPRVSGSLAAHYAPLTPVRLVDSTELAQVLQRLTATDLPVAVLMLQQLIVPGLKIIPMPTDPHAYAHDLYRRLRELDHGDFKHIIVEKVPAGVEWDAIRDRLQRASALI